MKRALLIVAALVALLVFARAGQYWSHEHAVRHEAGVMFDALGEPVEPVSPALIDTGAGVGLLLLGSWLVGQLIAPLGLPKVMGFLLFGVVCGPSVLKVISQDEMSYLVLVNDLAIALIALLAGAEIRVEFLRRSIRAVSLITIIEMASVLVGVTLSSMLIVPRLGLVEGGGAVFLVSLVIGTVLITNSPAVLLAVLTELRCRGEMTRISLAVTVCKDLLLVVLFTIVLAVAGTELRGMNEAGSGAGLERAGQSVSAPVGSEGGEAGARTDEGGGEPEAEGEEAPASKDKSIVLYLLQHLVGSIGVGVIVGLVMAWYLHRVDAHLPIFLVFSCFGIALMSEALDLETLIVAVVAGMLMENVWGERLEGFFETVEETSTPVFCVFFAVTGAKIDLSQVGAMWHWALALVVVRLAFVWLGTLIGARLSPVAASTRRHLWTAFVPQAGISLALALIVEETLGDLPLAEGLFTLLIGVIAINLLLGPLVLSLGLRASGERGEADTPESGEEGGSPP